MKNIVKISSVAIFLFAISMAAFPFSASASHDYGYYSDPYDCYWTNDCYRYPNTAHVSTYPGDNRFNQAPEFDSWPKEDAVVGEFYRYNVDADDIDGDRILYYLEDAPRGMNIDSRSGVIEWYPLESQADTYQYVVVVAEDEYGNERTQPFTIYIRPSRSTVYNTVQTQVPVTPTVIEVPVTRTVVVQAQPTTIVGSVSGINTQALEQYNVRSYADDNGNVFISWETNKPSRGKVYYGLASQATRGENFVYEYTSPDSGAVSTIHSVMLGQLQMDRTYYFRVVSEIGNETRVSPEHSFIRVEGGIGSIAATNNVALGSAIGVIGSAIFSPGFLLLIIIILLIAVVIRRRKNRVRVIEPAKIEIA